MRRFFDRRRLEAAYRDVFESESGKLVLHDLMRKGRFFRATYAKECPHDTAFMNGERNMVLHILAFLGKREQDIQDLQSQAKTYLVRENDDD